MTRDYAKRGTKKRRSTKPNKRKRSRKSKVSTSRWLFTVAGVAGLLGLLYYLTTIETTPEPAQAKGKPKVEEKSKDAEKVEFNFYTTLRDREIAVPDTPKNSTQKAEPVDTTKYQYFLQAGSFKKREDAEKRRVELLLLDQEAEIQAVKSKGTTWYRLQLGPFNSSSRLANTRSKLLNNGIDTMVYKRKAG